MAKLNSINKSVETVRRFFRSQTAVNHPLLSHPLAGKDEYTISLYLDMLCAVAEYRNPACEDAFQLIRRLMAGIGDNSTFEEHQKQGRSLTVEKAEEFVRQCKENSIRELFCIEGLLLICSGGTPQAEQIAMLAEFADMFGFSRKKLLWLGQLARSIAMQDSDAYKAAIKTTEISDVEKTFALKQLFCYTKDFVAGTLIDTKQLLYFCGANHWEKKTFAENALLESREEVIFENLDLSDNCITISCCDHVKIINCNLTAFSFRLNTVPMIEVADSTFKNCENPVLPTSDGSDLEIGGSVFLNCCGDKSGTDFTEPLFGMCDGSLRLLKCRFDQCSSSEYYSTICSRKRLRTEHCKFKDCQGACMFSYCTYSDEGSEFVNCTKIHN